MAITTEFEGYTLSLSEDPEEWHCRDLRLKAKTLKALKAKIQKHFAELRRVSLPVLVLDHNAATSKEGTITMIAKEDDWERNFIWHREDPESPQRLPTVWISIMDGNRAKREKKPLSRCIDPTNQDALDQLSRARELMAEADAMSRKAKAALDAVPRLTIEQLQARGAGQDQS